MPVAVEARGQCLVRDNHRGRPATRRGLLLERADAEHVVDVAVRVDGSVERPGRPGPDSAVHVGREREAAGVDQDEAVGRVEHGHVGEARDVRDARVELLELVDSGPGIVRRR